MIALRSVRGRQASTLFLPQKIHLLVGYGRVSRASLDMERLAQETRYLRRKLAATMAATEGQVARPRRLAAQMVGAQASGERSQIGVAHGQEMIVALQAHPAAARRVAQVVAPLAAGPVAVAAEVVVAAVGDVVRRQQSYAAISLVEGGWRGLSKTARRRRPPSLTWIGPIMDREPIAFSQVGDVG